jgi:hypothetical protein
MPGLYSHTTRAPGTLITALIYNFDHQVQVDSRTATIVQSYGTSISQFNITEDPIPFGVESLPSSLAGEVARLRFDIAALKTALNGGVPVNWYDPNAAPGFATIGARVVRAAAFAVPNAVGTPIDFTGNTADFNSGVWSAANPTRFTAPNTGLYFAAAGVVWDASQPSGRRQLTISGVDAGQQITNTTAATAIQQHQAITGLMKMVAGDFIEFRLFQDSGFAMTVIGSTKQSIVGSLVFLGSTT